MADKGKGSTIVIVFLSLIIGSTLVLGYSGKVDTASDHYHLSAVITFGLDLLGISGVIAGIGYATTGSLSGVAINGQNQYSLSRLQMLAWTVVVVAALFTYAKLNLTGYFGTVANPLAITIPGELLTAMGIAVATTGAAPAILALKKSQTDPSPEAIEAARTRFADTTGTPLDEVTQSGKLIGRSNRDNASWIDILAGDEAANAGLVDISKVQQFLITVLLLGVYIWAVVQVLGTAEAPPGALPPLSDDFIKLMALSHAGYLAYKVAPKAASESDTTPAQSTPAASSNAAASDPPAQSPVQMRLSVDDAANLSNLALTLDDAAVPIGADGFAELSLTRNAQNRIGVTAMHGPQKVSGTLLVVPTDTDHDLTQELSLV